MRIAVGSDHAGFELKSRVIVHLEDLGHEVSDLGTHDTESVDYPYYCARVGRAVVAEDADLGMVLGGSGQGEQITANKIRGVRAALCHNEFTARLARAHNDANVLALGGRVLGVELALAVVDVFLATGFEGGRHARRVEQIAGIEEEEAAK
ncbi:MAG: ribose 5-phosphate isomerase B [Actinomycetota bacterium]|nr:ribose 5-phosphate isomerase B [Actinomycetota bacterium]